MLSFLPRSIFALTMMLLLILLTIIICIVFFIILLFWLIIPIPQWQKKLMHIMFHMPSTWSKMVSFTMWLSSRTQWDITGIEHLSKQHSYLLIANHQSLLDILILQKIFDPYIPQLRYFMKRELIWLPLIGQLCWFLGYPFMQRFNKSHLAKYPEQRNLDLETTRKACERFRDTPITLINYVEGTRFTAKKQQQQQSPFKHLLKPKAGGVAFVLSALQGKIDTILNTTIIYPDNKDITWKFFQGKIKKITIHIETIKISKNLYGDYQNDVHFRQYFQTWLNQLWQEKDRFIAEKLSNKSDP